jgi:hypothetical protein
VGTREDAQNAGPLPQGQYTIGSQRDNETTAGIVLAGSMRLTPDSRNDMFGRAGFLMHGDNRAHDLSASEGCIVLSRPERDDVAASGIKTLLVEE